MWSIRELQAAGLYDPVADGPDRIEMLEWLHGQGFSIEQMVVALAENALGAMASDARLVPGERIPVAEAKRQAELADDLFDQIASAFGFLSVSGDGNEQGLVQAEVDAIAAFATLASMFSREEALGFVRVVGNSISRIAEAVIAMFLIEVESPHLQADGSELELARTTFAAVGLLDGFIPTLDPVLRRQMLQAIVRGRQAMIEGNGRLQYRYAVGFVDLVGFTPISHAMPAIELGNFIRDFEARAHDAVTPEGARLVKLIGDEVMFVAPNVDAACRVAESLMSSFATESAGEVAPSGGLAYGDVLVRGGDYYGTTVNLASRLASEAQPHELLVSTQFAAEATCIDFVDAGRRSLKGFADLVEAHAFTFAAKP